MNVHNVAEGEGVVDDVAVVLLMLVFNFFFDLVGSLPL